MMIQQSLHRSPPTDVIFAFTALEMLSKYAPLDTIINCLYNDRGSLLSDNLKALITLGKYESLEALLANLEKIEENREHIVEILESLGEYAPLDLLLKLLDDESCDVRLYTSLSLYKLQRSCPQKYWQKPMEIAATRRVLSS
jgi:HEAT repeat protein